IETLKENGNVNGKKEKTLAEEIKENKDALKEAVKTGRGEVTVKATVLRSSVAGNQQAVELPDVGQLAHARLTAYDIFRRIPVTGSNHNGVIRYYDWDEATKVRAAAMVAEGASFPESTAAWTTNTINIRKIGDTLPVSEEFFEDESMFAAELNMFLDTNVRIKRNDQIVNGDGTGENLKGIFASVDAYVPVNSGITDASIYDLFVKVSEDITSVGGSKYATDFGLMNIADINKMKLKKDANNNYVMPPFVSRDGSQVSGMIVLEENAVPANTMIVGDRRYARIYEIAGVQLSRGLVNAQFTSDLETLKARTRLAFLIREADKGGFRKVTDIAAALTTLATP
ncbi:MAG: phage major capsid protein, partial [Pseudoalteromonas tetraodonis]